MFSNTKTINLYARQRELSKAASTGKKNIKLLLPILAIVLVLGAAFAFFAIQNNTIEGKIADERAYASDGNVMQQYAESLLLEAQFSGLSAQSVFLTEATEAIDSYPVTDKALIEACDSCAGTMFSITSMTMNSTSGILYMDITTNSVHNMPTLVERLRATGKFVNIQYSGYTSNADGQYYSNVGCLVTPPLFLDLETQGYLQTSNTEAAQ